MKVESDVAEEMHETSATVGGGRQRASRERVKQQALQNIA